MRLPLLLLPMLLLAALPDQARACDPNCHTLSAVVAGAPTAIVVSLAAPAVGRALSARSDVPYWSAVGISAVASGAAILAVRSRTNPLTIDRGDLTAMIAAPALAGSAATVLVYWLWPRRPGVEPARARSWVPSVRPNPAGGIDLAWRR